MLNTSMTPPTVSQAAIERGVAKGKTARSAAFFAAIQALFNRAPAQTGQDAAHC